MQLLYYHNLSAFTTIYYDLFFFTSPFAFKSQYNYLILTIHTIAICNKNANVLQRKFSGTQLKGRFLQ